MTIFTIIAGVAILVAIYLLHRCTELLHAIALQNQAIREKLDGIGATISHISSNSDSLVETMERGS